MLDENCFSNSMGVFAMVDEQAPMFLNVWFDLMVSYRVYSNKSSAHLVDCILNFSARLSMAIGLESFKYVDVFFNAVLSYFIIELHFLSST